MSDDKTLYTVGEVAERFSLTVRTLHHWEAQGLLAPAERSWSNYRLYSVEDCARVPGTNSPRPRSTAGHTIVLARPGHDEHQTSFHPAARERASQNARYWPPDSA